MKDFGETVAGWAAVLAITIGVGVWWYWPDGAAVQPPPPPTRPQTPEERAEDLLRKADQAAADAAAGHVRRVNQFFRGRATRAEAFAARATSLEGSWLLVGGKLGLEDEGAHARFLRKAFESHLFTPDEVQENLDRVMAEYRRDLERADGQFVVDLRADLPDAEVLSDEVVKAMASGDTFRDAYGKLVAASLPRLEQHVAGVAATELSSLYLGNLAARGVIQAGVSAGLIGTGWGAALVVNLGVGVAVDALIDWVLKELGFDPAGDVAAEVRKSVEAVRAGVVDGDPAAVRAYDGLRRRQREAADPADGATARAEADRLALSGRLGLAKQFELMREARAAVRREIARQALAGTKPGTAK